MKNNYRIKEEAYAVYVIQIEINCNWHDLANSGDVYDKSKEIPPPEGRWVNVGLFGIAGSKYKHVTDAAWGAYYTNKRDEHETLESAQKRLSILSKEYPKFYYE